VDNEAMRAILRDGSAEAVTVQLNEVRNLHVQVPEKIEGSQSNTEMAAQALIEKAFECFNR